MELPPSARGISTIRPSPLRMIREVSRRSISRSWIGGLMNVLPPMLSTRSNEKNRSASALFVIPLFTKMSHWVKFSSQ